MTSNLVIGEEGYAWCYGQAPGSDHGTGASLSNLSDISSDDDPS
jgi:hypothetical protein